MSELREALDTMTKAVTAAQRDGFPAPVTLALVTIADVLSEIAAVLPAPHTVPKEPE